MDSTRRERALGTAGVLILLLVIWLVVTRTGAQQEPPSAVLGPMVDQPQVPAPTLPPAPTAAPTPEPTAIPLTHRVVAGETLASIAEQYRLTPEAIAIANGIEDINQIRTGQLLSLPEADVPLELATGELPGCRFRVDSGDTLWGIATDYSVSIESLREINGLSEDQSLLIGQVLQIPPESPAC
ncbi:MAG: LysM domain-containing protein [Chloroflexota bacterium]|nr:LysM domain-containing protein [Chloroflexota bacterium]